MLHRKVIVRGCCQSHSQSEARIPTDALNWFPTGDRKQSVLYNRMLYSSGRSSRGDGLLPDESDVAVCLLVKASSKEVFLSITQATRKGNVNKGCGNAVICVIRATGRGREKHANGANSISKWTAAALQTF